MCIHAKIKNSTAYENLMLGTLGVQKVKCHTYPNYQIFFNTTINFTIT